MSAVLWISQAHKCKALFPPTAVGNATYISHHLGEGHPSATAEQLQMFLHGDTDTQPFGESTWGQEEEGIAAKSPERGMWECPELPGRRAQRWAMMYSALLCLLPPGHRLSPQGKERLPSSGVTATSCNLSSGARHAATSFCKFIRENTHPYHRRQLFSGRHVVKTGPKFRCCFITFHWI